MKKSEMIDKIGGFLFNDNYTDARPSEKENYYFVLGSLLKFIESQGMTPPIYYVTDEEGSIKGIRKEWESEDG